MHHVEGEWGPLCPPPLRMVFTFLMNQYAFIKIIRFYKMYILLPIVMVKPIKLYTSVLIANSDWKSDIKMTTLRSRVAGF